MALAKQLEVQLAHTGDELVKVQTQLVETASQLALRSSYGEIQGRSAAMQAVYKLLDKFKGSDAAVLIRGESGTGKELVARAMHRDLEAMVREGTFREDLYFRLKVLELRLPPLRERRDDIPALVKRFLERHAEPARRPEVPPDVLRALINYTWPGNIRELENE